MGQIVAGGYLDRYNSLIKGLLGIKGEPFSELEPSLLADITIEQAPALAYEFYFLMGTTRYSSGQQTTAVPGAGLFSAVELRNPTGSGVIATIESIGLISGVLGDASNNFNLGLDQAALGGGIGFGTALDTREVTGKKSACQLRITAGSAFAEVTDGNAIDTQSTGAAGEEEVYFGAAPGIVIAPGHAVQVGARIAQIRTVAVFVFRERQLGASELKAA